MATEMEKVRLEEDPVQHGHVERVHVFATEGDMEDQFLQADIIRGK